MTSFSKYDIVVVKFPFASSLKYKARPATIEKDFVISKLGRLDDSDINQLEKMIGEIC